MRLQRSTQTTLFGVLGECDQYMLPNQLLIGATLCGKGSSAFDGRVLVINTWGDGQCQLKLIIGHETRRSRA